MDEPLYPRESLHCFQVIHVLYIDMFNFYLFIYGFLRIMDGLNVHSITLSSVKIVLWY